jgi:hypothetical protein
VVVVGEVWFEYRSDAERDAALGEHWVQGGVAAGESRDVDAAAGFVFAEVEAVDAVVEHGAARRLEVEAAVFDLGSMRAGVSGERQGQSSLFGWILSALRGYCLDQSSVPRGGVKWRAAWARPKFNGN